MVELKGDFENLTHYIKNIPADVVLYYNIEMKRCEKENAMYREVIVHGVRCDYSVSVIFQSAGEIVIRAIAACLYYGLNDERGAVLCLRRKE